MAGFYIKLAPVLGFMMGVGVRAVLSAGRIWYTPVDVEPWVAVAAVPQQS